MITLLQLIVILGLVGVMYGFAVVIGTVLGTSVGISSAVAGYKNSKESK